MSSSGLFFQGFRRDLFTRPTHAATDARQWERLEQRIPVNPFECALAPVIHPPSSEQREWPENRERISAFDRLEIIIEIE